MKNSENINLTLNDMKVLSSLLDKQMYGLEIIEYLSEKSNTKIVLGSLYNVLARLERNGLVESKWGDSVAERGGNRRRYYNITGLGEKVIEDAQFQFSSLWNLQLV